MTGLTTPDGLPYPNDYDQPADVPIAVKDLADATQAALENRSGLDHSHSPRVIAFGTHVIPGTLAVNAGYAYTMAIPSGSLILASVDAQQAGLWLSIKHNSASSITFLLKNSAPGPLSGSRVLYAIFGN